MNEAPENITISNDMVKENVPVGTVIGTFGTIDQDSGDTFTYSFAPGLTDTGPLAIKGNRLETTGPLDFESNDTYAIEVASVDAGGLEVVTSFLIQVVGKSGETLCSMQTALTSKPSIDASHRHLFANSSVDTA